jgi:hypothetical protein
MTTTIQEGIVITTGETMTGIMATMMATTMVMVMAVITTAAVGTAVDTAAAGAIKRYFKPTPLQAREGQTA